MPCSNGVAYFSSSYINFVVLSVNSPIPLAHFGGSFKLPAFSLIFEQRINFFRTCRLNSIQIKSTSVILVFPLKEKPVFSSF